MAKPEPYKGKDAVNIKCVKDYTVEAGSGPNAGHDIEFEAGKTYPVAPRSAQHLLRKVYAMHDKPKDGQKRGVYIGDGNFFVDPAADAEQAKADKAAAAARDARSDEAEDDKKADDKTAKGGK